MNAEPRMQRRFTIATGFAGLLIVVAVVLAHRLFLQMPDREVLAPATVEIRLEPVALDSADFAPLRLAGAWLVAGDDPRIGGVSALAVEGKELIALTDSGVVVTFAKPAAGKALAKVRELPAGPGDPRFKKNRDSEAIARDPAGRGWWVAFENSDELWLYDSAFERPLRRIAVPDDRLSINTGIEGLAASGARLLLLPESGGSALTLGPSGWSAVPFAFPARRVSGASAIGSDSLLAVERRLTLFGFANALVRLDRCPEGYCLAWRKALPLSGFDNVEAVATEPLASGATRLWLMTDDNSHRPLRQLLIAADLPPQL